MCPLSPSEGRWSSALSRSACEICAVASGPINAIESVEGCFAIKDTWRGVSEYPRRSAVSFSKAAAPAQSASVPNASPTASTASKSTFNGARRVGVIAANFRSALSLDALPMWRCYRLPGRQSETLLFVGHKPPSDVKAPVSFRQATFRLRTRKGHTVSARARAVRI